MAKEKSVFHYLQDSPEFNFGIFFWRVGRNSDICVVAIFRIQMEIKGKMNMLNAKPIIHDCQYDR